MAINPGLVPHTLSEFLESYADFFIGFCFRLRPSLDTMRQKWHAWVTAIKSAVIKMFTYPGIGCCYHIVSSQLFSLVNVYVTISRAQALTCGRRGCNQSSFPRYAEASTRVLKTCVKYSSSEIFLCSWCSETAANWAYILRVFLLIGVYAHPHSFQCSWVKYFKRPGWSWEFLLWLWNHDGRTLKSHSYSSSEVFFCIY